MLKFATIIGMNPFDSQEPRSGRGRKVIAIVGPTASGKTGIGVRLAKEFDGEIVSADSRQVFRRLNLGTGKDGEPLSRLAKSERRKAKSNTEQSNSQTIEQLRQNLRFVDGIPQWMIDIVDPGEKMTLFDYLPLARAAIDDILSRGKLPIIVGGTGLYVQALVEGFQLEQLKVESEKLKAGTFSREQLNNLTIGQLNNLLEKLDSEKHATIDQKNHHRLVRAIELVQEGVRPVKIKPDFEVLQIGLDLPRAELHAKIDRRVDERFEQGMLCEITGLLNSGVDSEWLAGLGLEYRIITDFVISKSEFLISNQCQNPNEKCLNIENLDLTENCKLIIENSSDFEAMSQDLKWKIHQFARRQLTWLRRFPEINWLSDYKEIERFVKIFLTH